MWRHDPGAWKLARRVALPSREARPHDALCRTIEVALKSIGIGERLGKRFELRANRCSHMLVREQDKGKRRVIVATMHCVHDLPSGAARELLGQVGEEPILQERAHSKLFRVS
jgi:hypothetical protein